MAKDKDKDKDDEKVPSGDSEASAASKVKEKEKEVDAKEKVYYSFDQYLAIANRTISPYLRAIIVDRTQRVVYTRSEWDNYMSAYDKREE